MSERLIMLSLSGIQEYISQSQKTSDLKMSSDMIVEMVKKLRQYLNAYVDAGNGREISFPLEGPMGSIQAADFILAEVTGFDEMLGSGEIEKDISVFLKKSAEEDADLFSVDVSCYVAVTADRGPGYSYETAWHEVSRRISALKNDRLKGIYFGHTSSVDKPEETLTSEGVAQGLCIVCHKRPGTIKTDNGQLCTECYKMRQKRLSFPSTWDIANITDLNENNKNNKYNKYKKSYYALIQVDLDDLGLYMSGIKGRLSGEMLSDYQKALVMDIGKFREALIQCVNGVMGSKGEKKELIIYCGGDDLLFFCPVDKIWEAVGKIDETLKSHLGKRKITCSKSIVIAHCKEPLRHVVQTSRQKLHEVKSAYSREGKGGLSLTFLYQGSGVRSIMVRNPKFRACAEQTQADLCSRKLSRSVIFVLEEELMPFGEQMDYEDYHHIVKIMQAEMRRVTARKFNTTPGETEQNIKYIQDCIIDLFQMFVSFKGRWIWIDMHSFFDVLCILDKCAVICRAADHQEGGAEQNE